MNAILFSANPHEADMADAMAHLEKHDRLYFSVRFPINASQFLYPLAGFIHISGDTVKYVARIEEILPFANDHFASPGLGDNVKPMAWLKERTDDEDSAPWTHSLVMSHIDRFDYDTYEIHKNDGDSK